MHFTKKSYIEEPWADTQVWSEAQGSRLGSGGPNGVLLLGNPISENRGRIPKSGPRPRVVAEVPRNPRRSQEIPGGPNVYLLLRNLMWNEHGGVQGLIPGSRLWLFPKISQEVPRGPRKVPGRSQEGPKRSEKIPKGPTRSQELPRSPHGCLLLRNHISENHGRIPKSCPRLKVLA